jgi:uncharacterized protein YutE (UPF0331/DUF86 family)
MAHFRNVLAHLYHDVDETRVHHILENELWKFNQFIGDVEALIEAQRQASAARKKSNGKKKTGN